MKIKKIMTRNPVCCLPDTPLVDVARMMVQRDCGSIPVVNDFETMKPVGILTDRDITIRSLANGMDPMNMAARDVMTTVLATLPMQSSVDDCCELMEERQIRRMIVVDDDGRCVGIVAQADIARNASEHDAAELVKDVSKSAVA